MQKIIIIKTIGRDLFKVMKDIKVQPNDKITITIEPADYKHADKIKK